MKLYAEIEDENGKIKGMASNEKLSVTVYDGNKKAYSVYIEYTDIGDLFDDNGDELPESEKTKGAIVTVREWRNQPEEKRIKTGKKQNGESLKCAKCASNPRWDMFDACEHRD